MIVSNKFSFHPRCHNHRNQSLKQKMSSLSGSTETQHEFSLRLNRKPILIFDNFSFLELIHHQDKLGQDSILQTSKSKVWGLLLHPVAHMNVKAKINVFSKTNKWHYINFHLANNVKVHLNKRWLIKFLTEIKLKNENDDRREPLMFPERGKEREWIMVNPLAGAITSLLYTETLLKTRLLFLFAGKTIGYHGNFCGLHKRKKLSWKVDQNPQIRARRKFMCVGLEYRVKTHRNPHQRVQWPKTNYGSCLHFFSRITCT